MKVKLLEKKCTTSPFQKLYQELEVSQNNILHHLHGDAWHGASLNTSTADYCRAYSEQYNERIRRLGNLLLGRGTTT